MSKYVVAAVAFSFLTFSAFAENVITRFDVLKINDDSMLLYKDRPLQPEIRGRKTLDSIGIYRLEGRDVVLLQDNGDAACPVKLYLVTVSQSGVKATAAFGTCSDLFDVTSAADAISISQSGFAGPNESKAAQEKAEKEQTVFVYGKDGSLTKNGKLVP